MLDIPIIQIFSAVTSTASAPATAMKLFLPTLLLAAGGAWARGFTDDCEDILMWDLGEGDDRDYVLEASCGHDKKRVILALDMCIANQGGKLVFRNQLVPFHTPVPLSCLDPCLNIQLTWLPFFFRLIQRLDELDLHGVPGRGNVLWVLRRMQLQGLQRKMDEDKREQHKRGDGVAQPKHVQCSLPMSCLSKLAANLRVVRRRFCVREWRLQLSFRLGVGLDLGKNANLFSF